MNILVFTESYPYDLALEATFIEPELPHLRAMSDRVIVVPARTGGARAIVPDGIEVDEGLAEVLRSAASPSLVTRALRSRLFWGDLVGRPRLLAYPRALRRLLGAAGRAELVRHWLGGRLADPRLSPADTVGYSFWCDHVTTGLTLCKRDNPELVVVSRAHNHDLYTERHQPPYLPCRSATLRYLDGLFPDSEQGVRYVSERHREFNRCEVARLGVVDPGFATAPSLPGRFVVVSCSLIVPVKRVDLIMRSVDRAARARPDLMLEWHHIGDGPLRAAVEQETRATLSTNAKATFHGQLSIEALIAFYRQQPIDAFVNASTMEGTPVSIMEAISCSIPIIATAVGGNPEIVSQRNGAVVSSDPPPEEIAAAIVGLIDDPVGTAAKRRASRALWDERYDAQSNYASFADRLRDIRGSHEERVTSG